MISLRSGGASTVNCGAQNLKNAFSQPWTTNLSSSLSDGIYRLRCERALVRLREVGCAELVLADDDAVTGQRVVSQAACRR